MLIGLGQDIQHLPEFGRAQHLIQGDAFFSAEERRHAEHSPKPLESYAGMFCAKEALFKAAPLPQGARWTDIEVVHERGQAPHLRFHGALGTHFRDRGWTTHLSISHSGEYAAAVVAVCRELPGATMERNKGKSRDA